MYNDHTTREERLGIPGSNGSFGSNGLTSNLKRNDYYVGPDDTSTPWALVIVLSILFFIALGLAGSADLLAM